MHLRFFHYRDSQRRALREGRWLRCFGEVRRRGRDLEIVHPEYRVSDAPPGITISVPRGQVNVNCLQANLTAQTLLSVSAPVAQFSGVVLAQAVISNAYNPAPGNTFGA